MNILLTYGPPFSREQVDTFVQAWRSVSPDDHFDIVPFDTSENTLRHFWDKDDPLHTINADDPFEAGRALRKILDNLGDRRAKRRHCSVMIEGPGYPDGGYAFLQGLTQDTASAAHRDTQQQPDTQQHCEQSYEELLEQADRLLRDVDLDIYSEDSDVLLGLDGMLTRWHQGQRDEFGHVIRPATDEQEAYQQVRIVSERMRQAHAYGQRPRHVSPSSKQVQDVSDDIAGDKPHVGTDEKNTLMAPSGKKEMSPVLHLVASTPVQAGFIPGGAIAGGAGEVLVRLGKRLRLCADAIDDYAQIRQRIARSDLIICTADSVQSWTIDDLLSARIVPVNQGHGKALLLLAWSSDIGRREMGDNGIDSVCTIPRASASTMTPSEQLTDAGIRCARTWSHMR